MSTTMDCEESPPGPLAVRTYVILRVGETVRSPWAGTSPTPEMEVSTAFEESQFRVVDLPQSRLELRAESCAETGAIGTVALAIPARKRGCGGRFKPSFHSLVFVLPF